MEFVAARFDAEARRTYDRTALIPSDPPLPIELHENGVDPFARLSDLIGECRH
jgi:hypothetical protein